MSLTRRYVSEDLPGVRFGQHEPVERQRSETVELLRGSRPDEAVIADPDSARDVSTADATPEVLAEPLITQGKVDGLDGQDQRFHDGLMTAEGQRWRAGRTRNHQ